MTDGYPNKLGGKPRTPSIVALKGRGRVPSGCRAASSPYISGALAPEGMLPTPNLSSRSLIGGSLTEASYD